MSEKEVKDPDIKSAAGENVAGVQLSSELKEVCKLKQKVENGDNDDEGSGEQKLDADGSEAAESDVKFEFLGTKVDFGEEEVPLDAADEADPDVLTTELELFLKEVETIEQVVKYRKMQGARKPGKIRELLPLGSSAFQVERLANKRFASAFEALMVDHDATEEEIKKQYRRMSLLIHPDKCRLEKAHEAFQVATKAYQELQQEEFREKYQKVFDEAKQRVDRAIQKENKKREEQRAAPFPTSGVEYRLEIRKMCEHLLKETADRKEYGERVKKANEDYQRQIEEDRFEEIRQKDRKLQEWEKNRDVRVEGWQTFQDRVKQKEINFKAFQNVKHKREQRTVKDPKLRKRPMGIDESYKDDWR